MKMFLSVTPTSTVPDDASDEARLPNNTTVHVSILEDTRIVLSAKVIEIFE
jgi:hypothetical protein